MGAVPIFNNPAGVTAVLSPPTVRPPVSVSKGKPPPVPRARAGVTGEMRYYLLSLFREAAASADCSWRHQSLGRHLAFHLELRFGSSCREELSMRWPLAQTGLGRLLRPSSPGPSNCLPSIWSPLYSMTLSPTLPCMMLPTPPLKYPSLHCTPGTLGVPPGTSAQAEADVPALRP